MSAAPGHEKLHWDEGNISDVTPSLHLSGALKLEELHGGKLNSSAGMPRPPLSAALKREKLPERGYHGTLMNDGP